MIYQHRESIVPVYIHTYIKPRAGPPLGVRCWVVTEHMSPHSSSSWETLHPFLVIHGTVLLRSLRSHFVVHLVHTHPHGTNIAVNDLRPAHFDIVSGWKLIKGMAGTVHYTVVAHFHDKLPVTQYTARQALEAGERAGRIRQRNLTTPLPLLHDDTSSSQSETVTGLETTTAEIFGGGG